MSILDSATVANLRRRFGEHSQIARLCESHERLRGENAELLAMLDAADFGLHLIDKADKEEPHHA